MRVGRAQIPRDAMDAGDARSVDRAASTSSIARRC
jgi:hypothetical protein